MPLPERVIISRVCYTQKKKGDGIAMNIRRQKQIKAFLVEEFGADRGNALFHSQEKTLYTLIENEGDKSGAQRKTLAQTILPCIALYKALLQDSSLREGAHGYVQKYMLEKVAAEKHASTAKMEAVPGFYRIYSSVFLRAYLKTVNTPKQRIFSACCAPFFLAIHKVFPRKNGFIRRKISRCWSYFRFSDTP